MALPCPDSRNMKGIKVAVIGYKYLFFGCQLLEYVSRAVRPSVSYNNDATPE